MGQPFIGEIRMFAGNFAPVGWAFCNGALIAISDNDALFNLIGTTYGGDGVNTFALPNLQSRVPVHVGPGFAIGQAGGVETVTLTTSQIPAHSHVPACRAGTSNSPNPAGNFWGGSSAFQYDTPANGTSAMATGAIASTGDSQPHDNMIPFITINYIISLSGVFPSQT